MGHTYASLLTHCIFSTKDRAPHLTKQIAPGAFAYMGGIVRSFGGVPLLINGVADHVHMLVSLPPTIAVAEAMRLVKANSSKWIHEQWPDQRAFGWQNGYGAFSVSRSNQETVLTYIAGQEEHHETVTFQEEFLAFLRRHGIEFDERYVWQ
jgi:REP element-mobilizing transposase RayT